MSMIHEAVVFFGAKAEGYDDETIDDLCDGNGVIAAVFEWGAYYVYIEKSRQDTVTCAPLSLPNEVAEDRWRAQLRAEAAKFGVKVGPYEGRWFLACPEVG